MEKVVRGVRTNDMVAPRLRMTHTLCDPPSFSQLLREVREEEDWINARDGGKSLVSATTSVSQASSGSELEKKHKARGECTSLTIFQVVEGSHH